MEKLLKSGIFEMWHEKTFADYTGDNPNILEHLIEYCKDFTDKRGLILTGINGIGKTMLMNIVIKNAILSGKSGHIIPYWFLIQEYIASWKGEGNFNKLLKIGYLGINDFGKGYEGSDKSLAIAKSAIELVLDYRIQREKPTIITTNLQIKDFRAIYGNDIASKLNESGVFLKFKETDRKGEDFRVINSKLIEG